MLAIIEPIAAGICVSLINKLLLNTINIIWSWCSTPTIVIDHEDNISSSKTTISDISLEAPHVHIHEVVKASNE